jgi:hypothetical protein
MDLLNCVNNERNYFISLSILRHSNSRNSFEYHPEMSIFSQSQIISN